MDIVPVDLEKDYSNVLTYAVRILKAGGVVVYPTDTAYGLGANALDRHAVQRVCKIKGRSHTKPIPILARNMTWVRELADIQPAKEATLEKVWPGKVTVILRSKSIIPDIITAGTNTVSIRIPDHPLTDRLLGMFGYPLTASSANCSGQEPSRDIHAIMTAFSYASLQPDLIIDAGTLRPAEPSLMLDLTGDRPTIVRIGAAKPHQLLKVLKLT